MTTLVSGGCIRLYSNGPEWHINEEHHTVGLVDAAQQPTIDSSGFLVIHLLDVGERAVVSMTAASDETLTKEGISVGCSNGGPINRMRFYKDGVGPLNLNDPVHWGYVEGIYSNLWITMVHDVAD